MKNRNTKGKGQSTSRQLSASEKVTLTLWMDKNKDACVNLSAEELVIRFKEETGLDVSVSSILTMRNAVFPEIKRTYQPRKQNFDPTELIEKMNQLHRRISKIESELGMLTL
jgi:hypothetical protein